MNGSTHFRQLLRLTVTGIACAVALAASMTGTPASATATGENCPTGDFCLFSGSGATGSMTVYRKSTPTLGTAGTRAHSWVNRTSSYSCLFPGTNYTTPSGSPYALWSADPASGGNYAWDNTSSVPGSQGHLTSLRLSPTSHECQSGKEYLPWDIVQPGDDTPKSFGSFMGNGTPQLLMRSVEGNLWLMPGDPAPGIKLGTGWNGMTLLARHGDFTGDGREDVIARSSTGHLYIYPGQGTSLGARRDLGGGWNAMTAIVPVGDLGADGRGDLLARDKTGVLWMYPGNSSGTFSARRSLGAGWNTMTALVAPGDLNGDSHSDLLARDKSGTLWDYPGTGTGTFGKRHTAATGVPQSVKLLAIGDIDGDDANDLYAIDYPYLDLYSGTGTGTLPHSKYYWQTYQDFDSREPLF